MAGDNLLDRSQLITATTRGKARLEQIEADLQAVTFDSPLLPLLDAEDIQAT